MKNKIKVAFIYEKSCTQLSGNYHSSLHYNFFINALNRNTHLDVNYFAASKEFDTNILKNKFDIILLYGNQSWMTPKLIGIRELDIPVICRAGDPHHDKKNAESIHEKYKINHYFGTYPHEIFYKDFPKNFKFKTIIYGLESSLYQKVTPFNQRIKDRILNSGVIGISSPFSRFTKYFLRRHFNIYKYYKLRTECNKLPFVDYTHPKDHKFIGDNYSLLLEKYATAIAATTVFPTQKYWEIPAAGCLTFMEITKENYGEFLGFKDGESAIFINEKNYKEKFSEYISDTENPKWEKIANEGQKFTMNELNNDKATESLVELMQTYL